MVWVSRLELGIDVVLGLPSADFRAAWRGLEVETIGGIFSRLGQRCRYYHQGGHERDEVDGGEVHGWEREGLFEDCWIGSCFGGGQVSRKQSIEIKEKREKRKSALYI